MTIKVIFFFYTSVTVFYKVFIIKLGMALAIFKLFSQSQVSNTIAFSNHCVQHFFICGIEILSDTTQLTVWKPCYLETWLILQTGQCSGKDLF